MERRCYGNRKGKMLMKALLLGDYTQAPFHALRGIDEKIKDILHDSFDLTITEDYSLLSQDLGKYKLIISYSDRWEDELRDSEAGGLVSYVARGGGLLVIHNGISLCKRKEIKSLTGAWFTGHPQAQMLSFQVLTKHPICEGIGNFQLYEEPYQYDFCNHIEQDVFLTYDFEGLRWKSGWTVNFGEGKVVCLHPGHRVEVFDDPCYRQIIRRSAWWCVNT
jgi:type 1 glutamine amidotransferase